jgi:hypothetical protein
MFLVLTFCEIVMNGLYILKMVKKKSNKFFRYQEWFFSTSVNLMIISGPHYLNFGPYIL